MKRKVAEITLMHDSEITADRNGWAESASAWISSMGERGDFGREFVLDRPMLELASREGRHLALDVGCGEGRFCRMLQARGLKTVGIDPTLAMIERARELDPAGEYLQGQAERLNFPDASFDLVVSYLTLIDISNIDLAIAEMARVLRPGGSLLIANLTSYSTAGVEDGRWSDGAEGEPRFHIDNYLMERAEWVHWSGIHVRNWHRPLERYMSLLIDQGLVLRHFSEPRASGGSLAKCERYNRVPWFLIMAWDK